MEVFLNASTFSFFNEPLICGKEKLVWNIKNTINYSMPINSYLVLSAQTGDSIPPHCLSTE